MRSCQVELLGCEVSSCSHAVLLSGSPRGSLRASGCHFSNVRVAVCSERSCFVDIERCAFNVSSSADVRPRLARRSFVCRMLNVSYPVLV